MNLNSKINLLKKNYSMEKINKGIVCALMILSTSPTFANKNPCNVDCVQRLIDSNATVGAASGIGYATSGMLLGLARNPSLKNQLASIFNQTVSIIVIDSQSKKINDCANGFGIASAGLMEAFADNPSLRTLLVEFYLSGLASINSICHTNYNIDTSLP